MDAKNENDKALTVANNSNKIQLNNNGGLQAGQIINHALANLTPEQMQNIAAKATEEALRLEVKAREQEQDYRVGRQVINDHIDTFQLISKEGKLTRQKVESEITTGAGKMRIESKSGAACFVATATYGDPEHPDVVFLRAFRDSVLTNYVTGRAFIKFYWVTGPQLAKLVKKCPKLQKVSLWFIKHIIAKIRTSWQPRS